MRPMTSFRIGAVLTALALPVFITATAHAGLTIDLRLANGGGKGVDVFTPGATIPIDVYAIVTGTSSGVEGLQSVQGALIGTGDALTGQIVPAGDLDQATFTITLPAVDPFTGNGAQRGESKHIGVTDGIVDLGDITNRGEDLGNLVVFRSDSMQVNSGTVIPDGREFRIGRIELVVDEFSQGCSSINWAFRRGPNGEPVQSAALFRQDGVISNGTGDIAVGAPILFPALCPEPSGVAVLAGCAACLAVRRRGKQHDQN